MLAWHGITLTTFAWHLFFDALGNIGSYRARKFCSHWWHRWLLVAVCSLTTTFALVTLVG